MRISRKKRPSKPLIPRYDTNERIRALEVRLLDFNGNNLGIVPIAQAIAKAREQEMDLVEINPKIDPPVCKIIDFNHFKYQKEKEARKQKVRAHETEIKGIRLSIRISDHDIEIKQIQSERFLNRGDKVKLEIILRGRENAKPDIAFEVINNFFLGLQKKMDIRFEQDPGKQANKVTAIIAKK